MMKRNRNNLGVEIIVILLAFLFSILILTRAFAGAKVRSSEAAILSDAVTLASNIADTYLACEDEKIAQILNENGNIVEANGIEAYYDEQLHPASNGRFRAKLKFDRQGLFEKAYITIFYDGNEVYALETGKEVKR